MGASSDQQCTSRTGTPLGFDEVRWVANIRHSVRDDVAGDDDDDTGIPVSVFNVPKQLHAQKPDAYTPQFIALGPYHHWRPELYEMERYKLSAARRAQRRLRAEVNLEDLVDQFKRVERKVRAYYHRYLDFNDETLAWVMVVDGAFLLEFLQIYAAAEAGDGGRALGRRVSSKMSHLLDFTGTKCTHSLILRDMLMLENQVPLFLLRKMLEPQCASSDEAGELLARMVTGLMKELCPLKMVMQNFPVVDAGSHAHLLEALYYILVPPPRPRPADDPAAQGADDSRTFRDEGCGCDIEEQAADCGGAEEEQKPAAGGEYVKQLFVTVWGIVSRNTSGPVREYVTKPIEAAIKVIAVVVPGVGSFTPGAADGTTKASESSAGGGYLNRPPLIEEIMVPSVSELVNAGVKFLPTTGDLFTIAFQAETATFHLPVATLDFNTEVVLRNLVAYEALAASGPPVLARYTELMNGIIDTEEDVALLRRRGVVLNRMKSDDEVAKLWNGMTRSVCLSKVAFVDKAIEEVNRYYNSRWRVKAKRFMRKYVFSSWQLLTLLAAILLLLLNALQAFCSVYTCSRWLGAVTVAKAA